MLNILTHSSILHLVGNLFLLGVFFPPVWRDLSALQLIALLTAAQIGGCAAQSLSDWLIADPRPMFGVSAIGYGLIAAYGLLFPQSFPIGFVPATGRQLAVIATICTVALAVLAPRSSVAHAAHLGGMAGASFLILVVYLRSHFYAKRRRYAVAKT